MEEEFSSKSVVEWFFRVNSYTLNQIILIICSIFLIYTFSYLSFLFSGLLGSLTGFLIPFLSMFVPNDIISNGRRENYGLNALIALVTSIAFLFACVTQMEKPHSNEKIEYEKPIKIVKTSSIVVLITETDAYTTNEMKFDKADDLFVCHYSFENVFTEIKKKNPYICVKE